ncbi:MAG: hypothetical protein EXR65_02355 [Dehalococcoidia bacterium]|nr:hypothetical protein [Dehalococcoidia bacterium]
MAASEVLELALRLWAQARDRGAVDDPSDLDRLLEAQGRPGAPGYDCGQRFTFACFPPDTPAELTLPTGERAASDEEARFLAHLLVTRTLLVVGLDIDERVEGAMCDAYARTWAARAGDDHCRTPLALALSLWLVALDQRSNSDRPLPIDWSVDCFRKGEHWDPDYPLVSHYDMRERAQDWAMYVSMDPRRHPGVSVWTIVEPLLRFQPDSRTRTALAKFAEARDVARERAPAAAMLERNRIAGLLRSYLGHGGGSLNGASR